MWEVTSKGGRGGGPPEFRGGQGDEGGLEQGLGQKVGDVCRQLWIYGALHSTSLLYWSPCRYHTNHRKVATAVCH